MAETLNRLNAKTITSLKTPGRHADGGNLYLSVSKTGAKSWVFFFTLNGRQREMGLGSFPDISLGRAREKAEAARRDLKDEIDPLEKRNLERSKPKAKTFGKCAEEYIEEHKAAWKNSKHNAMRATVESEVIEWCDLSKLRIRDQAVLIARLQFIGVRAFRDRFEALGRHKTGVGTA